jgi:hypothetical protein
MSCSRGGGEEEEASVWAYCGRSAQGPPGLYSTFRPASRFPFITVVESPSTSAGGPTSSYVPMAGCSTSSSTSY